MLGFVESVTALVEEEKKEKDSDRVVSALKNKADESGISYATLKRVWQEIFDNADYDDESQKYAVAMAGVITYIKAHKRKKKD